MSDRKNSGPDDRLFRRVLDKLAQNPPELSDPEGLTEEILRAVSGTPPQRSDRKIRYLRPVSGRILVLQRLLAAASVFLLLILGVEQYGILSDINTLERQSKHAGQTIRNPHPYERLRSRKSGNILSEKLTAHLLLKTNSAGLTHQNPVLP